MPRALLTTSTRKHLNVKHYKEHSQCQDGTHSKKDKI